MNSLFGKLFLLY